jgi:predicted transcriptional regulator of viral defense system
MWHDLQMKKENMSFPEYINQLQAQGRYWFLREESMQTLKITENAFRKATARLIEQHRLAHVRRNFYVIVPLEYQATASLPATWFIDALMKHFDQPYYVGLLSAAALHDAAHQQPMVFQIMTNQPIRPISVGQVRLEFHHKKEIKLHFYQPIKTASGTMNVSTPEMTAFDLVRYPHASGQIHHVATVLTELIEQITPEKLALLFEKNDVEIASAQRLGYLLEKLGGIDVTLLHQQLCLKKHMNRLLVPAQQTPILEKNKRWRIFVNESIEVDEL